jgi:hypothetical protein
MATLIIALIMVGTVSASVSLPPMTLTIVGPHGTQVVLNETDIGNMESYRDAGGMRTSYPALQGWGYYTGVSINTFCNLVGGLHTGQTLRVTASDGYNRIFTYAQINGDFVTYAKGDPNNTVPHYQSLTTILAYHCNDTILTSGGPLRFAIVGPEGLYTPSAYWVKSVVKLQILDHDIAVTDVAVSAPEVKIGNIVTIDVDVENHGDFPETFNATVKYDSTSIETQTGISLGSKASTTLTFTWNTTGISMGTYTISAEVPPVPSEVDTADNTLVDGQVVVTDARACIWPWIYVSGWSGWGRRQAKVGTPQTLEAWVISINHKIMYNVKFQIKDSVGTVVAEVWASGSTFFIGTAKASWTPTEAGTYYIRAYLYYGTVYPVILGGYSWQQSLKVLPA